MDRSTFPSSLPRQPRVTALRREAFRCPSDAKLGCILFLCFLPSLEGGNFLPSACLPQSSLSGFPSLVHVSFPTDSSPSNYKNVQVSHLGKKQEQDKGLSPPAPRAQYCTEGSQQGRQAREGSNTRQEKGKTDFICGRHYLV